MDERPGVSEGEVAELYRSKVDPWQGELTAKPQRPLLARSILSYDPAGNPFELNRP